MKNVLKNFKSKRGTFLGLIFLSLLFVGCKDDDYSQDKFSGEYFYRINSVTTNTVITAKEQPTEITFFSFNFPYLYTSNDKACNDLAQFMNLAGDITFYGYDVVGKDTIKYAEKKATLTTDGSNLVSFKTKDNLSYEFAFDGTKLTSFALKEDGTATIELEDEKIKTIGSNVPDYKQDFKYPTGVKIKLDTVKEGNDEFIKQKGEITFETLKGDNYLVLLSGDYDSLFCITTKTENSVIRSYRTWGYDTLVIASAKDTTFIKEEKVVKGTDGNPLKSVVDPTKDSVIITKKTISLPLLLDNIDDETMKLEGVNFVSKRKLQNAAGTGDSIITDTIKSETGKELRKEVYKYYVIARYPREVWKSEIKYLNGLSNGKTVKSISGVSVEEIAYEKKEAFKSEAANVGKPSHFKEVSRKTNTVSVTFDSHGVTK